LLLSIECFDELWFVNHSSDHQLDSLLMGRSETVKVNLYMVITFICLFLQKLKIEQNVTSTSLGGSHGNPLLSPPPREVCLSTSNLSNDGGSSYESPSSFALTENGTGSDNSSSEHRNTLKTTSSVNEILDAMRATHAGGLTFFNRIPGLPPLTFIGTFTDRL
jgi:hypothetical protein